MGDLLTTRQLQELLQVDRVTIYRMLGDGRLTGFKVGGQWRFSRQEIERWLEEQRATLEVAKLSVLTDESSSASHLLPLSCIQAMQSVYAEALDIAAVTTEPDGTPLTEISNSCKFCSLILATEEGLRRCAASWRPQGRDRESFSSLWRCHAGLLCTSVAVKAGSEWVANVASCQFVTAAANGSRGWAADLSALATDLGLAEAELRSAAEEVRSLTETQQIRVSSLLRRVADTFAEIGQERWKLLDRLQRIAEMTNI